MDDKRRLARGESGRERKKGREREKHVGGTRGGFSHGGGRAWQTGDEIKAKEKAHNVAALPNYCD